MWKYVSRRIRDTFERSVNHFDKRSTTGVVNASGNVSLDNSKRSSPPCFWFASRRCWNSHQGDNDTNSKRWNFEHLNCSWIGAITWVRHNTICLFLTNLLSYFLNKLYLIQYVWLYLFIFLFTLDISKVNKLIAKIRLQTLFTLKFLIITIECM